MINILFFGSSIHSLKIINALNHYDDTYYRSKIVGLVSSTTPVSEFAKKNSLPLFQPEPDALKPWEIKDPQNLLGFVKKLNPDIIIVTYFGQKIPLEVINFPKFGAMNIHPSLLPNYPGSSPAVWAILEGKKETGVTILKMNENFDEGEIIAQEKEKIKDSDTPENLYERLFKKGADLLIKTLPDYLSGKIKPRPQGKRSGVYARRLTREDGKIDWAKSPVYLERFIRAMTPWPGSWTEIKINGQTKKLKILKSHLENKKLILDSVQLEGKNPVTFKQFLLGYPEVKLPFSF